MRNHCYENDFDLHENETGMQNSFSYEWFRTYTRFETEAQGNSEMAYSEESTLNRRPLLLTRYVKSEFEPSRPSGQH